MQSTIVSLWPTNCQATNVFFPHPGLMDAHAHTMYIEVWGCMSTAFPPKGARCRLRS